MERRIGTEISALANRIKRRLPEIGTGSDKPLTSMQMWIIGYLFTNRCGRHIFQGDLEAEFNITRATTSSILKRMERDGLIVRVPVAHDARLKKILLTDKSIRNAVKAKADIDRVEDMMKRGLSAGELEQLFSILGRIKANLE